MYLIRTFTFIIIASIIGIAHCTDDPPEATGTFNVQFSGNISDQLQGNASFRLDPLNTNGLIIVRLDESEFIYLRLSFFNPDPNQIFLEPGSYNVVDRLGQNIPGEVLVDYVNEQGSFNAASGEIRVGIVKNSQIKGELVNVRFNLLNSSCNGSFDAIPE